MKQTRLTSAVAFAVASLTLSAPVFAVDDVADAADERVKKLDQVIVVGEKASTPLHYETDPKKPRQPMPASDGADYLKSFPGFTSLRTGGTNSDPIFRGMFGSRLNVVTNDGAMHGACPARMDNALSYVAPATFDRLLIVKGPQTVLGGPGASAGTVRFERETEAFDAPDVRVYSNVTAARFQRMEADVDVTAGNRTGYARFVGNHAESNDYRDGHGAVVPSQWSHWNADATLGLTPTPDALLEVTVGRGDGTARYGARSMDGSRFWRESAGLKFVEKNLETVDEWSFNFYMNDSDHVMDNYTLRQPNPNSMMAMPMVANVGQEVMGARLDVAMSDDDWSLAFGGAWQQGAHRQRVGMGVDGHKQVPWVHDANDRIVSLFGEWAWQWDASNRWVSGLRVDWASVTDERATVGVMNPQPNPTQGQTRQEALPSVFTRLEHTFHDSGWVGYVGLGHVQRMPDYWELFSPLRSPSGGLNAFPEVQPEVTTQLDVGVTHHSPQWDVDISAYLGHIDDYLLFTYTQVSDPMMGDWYMSRVQNTDAIIRGFEASTAWRASDALTLRASLAHAWGEQTQRDKPLPQMTPTELRLAAEYGVGHWQVGGLLRVVGAQNRIALDEGNVVGRDIGSGEALTTLALHGSYQVNDHWRAYVGVDNVFDRTYSEHLNLTGSADFGFPADPVRINEPGRVWWARVTFTY